MIQRSLWKAASVLIALISCSIAAADPGDVCVLACGAAPDSFSHALVRLDRTGTRVQCAGPNSQTCSEYQDSSCTRLISGSSQFVIGQGLLCPQTPSIFNQTNGICASGYAALLLPEKLMLATCEPITPWIILRSCPDKGNLFVDFAVVLCAES